MKACRSISKKSNKAKENSTPVNPEIAQYKSDDQTGRIKEKLQKEADFKTPSDADACLEIRHIKKTFTLKRNIIGRPKKEVSAVDNVSFKLLPAETLGIIGEAGSGKTTLGRTVLKLVEPSDGQILFCGEDITDYSKSRMKRNINKVIIDVRGGKVICNVKYDLPLRAQMQTIFESPYTSLPLRSTVESIVAKPVREYRVTASDNVEDYVLDLIKQCDLEDNCESYPHELSGSKRQKISIARAIATNPKLLVYDEPTAEFDAMARAEAVNLLKNIQRSKDISYIFISDDLAEVEFMSDKVGVMCSGAMVEFGSKEEIFKNPRHPYTKALIAGSLIPEDKASKAEVDENEIPADPTRGCKFCGRCPYASSKCKYVTPTYREYERGHFAACHLCEGEIV